MSVSDIEEQIKEIYNFDISTSTIYRVTNAIFSEAAGSLEDLYLIAWKGSFLKFEKIPKSSVKPLT